MKRLGYIDVDGNYQRGIVKRELAQASIDKQYRHDMQRLDHKRDLLQPYANGKPNPEFIEQYPEESKQHGFY